MKNLWIFGAAAVLSLAACSKNIDPEDPGAASGTKGDLYMTMTITPTGSVGTRATTTTPNQGTEVGQDDENKIGSALIVFAKEATPNKGDYKVFATLKGGDISGTQSPYLATYKMDRNILLNDVKSNPDGVTYSLFVIANPTREIETTYETAAASPMTTDVQQEFTLSEDADTYWSASNGFLMSNAELGETATIKITEDMVAVGTHTEATDPLRLGSVTVQRAMSRFDINTEESHLKFTVENQKAPITSLSLEFDAVALINMAKTANMFKVTAEKKSTLGDKTISFFPSREGSYKDYWVFSPDQNNDYIYPLFSGLAAGSDGKKFTGTAQTLTDPGFDYTELSTLDGGRDTFTKPSDAISGEPLTGYKFWRYCMENTNPDDPKGQLNGNSTGVIFRAKIDVTPAEEKGFEKGDALYAYGNVVFGNAVDLRDYALNVDEDQHTDDLDVFRTVSNHYNDAVEAYKAMDSNQDWTPEEKDKAALAVLDAKLVAEGFTIYRANGEANDYYCYYFYWNRHNNNNAPTQMGIMEFATVRNNVYKLYVSKVLRLGHPAIPGDDPDPEDPNDPDEEDNFYCQIECKVLDWEVRMNGIEF